MARYNGPKTKISRIFGEPILGNGKWLGKNSNPPGQHGEKRKRNTLGDYALQLRDQAQLQARYLDTLDAEVRRHGPTPAVVLAPRMVSLWSKTPAWEIGTLVLEWPKPPPDLSDPILILQDKPGAAETARQLLRGRPIYRLEPAPGALFTLRPL